jgi:peptidoglycan endopeptidase LytF
MYKYFSVLLLSAFFNISGAEAEISRDSIGVENLRGKKVIIHRIVAHDTYYSVGRRYNVSPKEILTYNDNKFLQIGVIIKVPTSLDFNKSKAAKPGIQSQSAETATGDNQLIEYTIKPKDNLNRLAENYGTTIAELKRINDLSSSNLHIGQVLKIPIKGNQASTAVVQESPAVIKGTPGVVKVTPAATQGSPVVIKGTPMVVKGSSAVVQPPVPNTGPVKAKPIENTRKVDSGLTKTITVPVPNTNTDADEEFIEHTVASNETIYSIATTYHLTIDQLKAKNNLSSSSLHVGQRLLIKGQYRHLPKQSSSEPLTSSDTTLKNPSLRGAPSKYGLNQVDEKGTGIWITDPDLDPIKMLVLHRTAPIGTIIKVTNPMTNRSTFAKVVGKFTENESTKDVIIVMTKAVAESIGALDKRFFCNLTYSGQEIEQ